MEQKLVQRCETKIDADACKASYKVKYSLSTREIPRAEPEGFLQPSYLVKLTLLCRTNQQGKTKNLG